MRKEEAYLINFLRKLFITRKKKMEQLREI